MKTNILNYNNRKGYGEKAYNHVKKKGGILCVENSHDGLNLYLLR